MVYGAATFREVAVAAVRGLKAASDVSLRSQANLSLNWSLLAAGLVDGSN